MSINSKLRVLLAIKEMNINGLVNKTGLSQPTISKLFNNKPDDVKTVKLDTIEKICAALNCQPGDIMEYIPEQQGEGD